MEKLYIEVSGLSSKQCFVSIETLVTVFIYKLSDNIDIKLFIKTLPTASSKQTQVLLDLSNINYEVSTTIPNIAFYCKWPVIVKENHVIAGVCSVARELIKRATTDEMKDLLGFRGACLMACAETSIWTRFCEINMIAVAKNALQNEYEIDNVLTIPEEILRFEFHMSQPVKMHNVYKLAREQNTNGVIDTKTQENLNINHCFSEGPTMTLADAILYPNFRIFFQKYSLDSVRKYLPLTCKWFKKIDEIFQDQLMFGVSPTESKVDEICIVNYLKRSLYIGDAPSHRTEKGVFTKQDDIENALQIVSSLETEVVNKKNPFGYEIAFDWEKIPLLANPNGGALPKKRASRKCEQLENLVRAVVKLAKDKRYKIVDFCSGSGHLGLLLGISLPMCEVILVENKEHSLERAQDRISSLNLTNISIIQSNLDYFHGDFDIGVALHACGVATDLVIKTCIDKKAHFVVCPCCYGGVKNCFQVSYPLSEEFKKLRVDNKFYFTLSHAADQTHDEDNVKTKQGFVCMDVIDSDRLLYAKSFNYEVHFGKLLPVTCTNKNNLLVGIYKDKS